MLTYDTHILLITFDRNFKIIIDSDSAHEMNQLVCRLLIFIKLLYLELNRIS